MFGSVRFRIVNMLNNHASLLDLSCTTAKMPDERPVYIILYNNTQKNSFLQTPQACLCAILKALAIHSYYTRFPGYNMPIRITGYIPQVLCAGVLIQLFIYRCCLY